MPRKAPLLMIEEQGGNEFSSLAEAQKAALPTLTVMFVEAIQRMIASGAFTVREGRLIVTEKKREKKKLMVEIYVLRDPRTGVTRYVGQTCQSLATRYASHIHKPTNKQMEQWIVELKSHGMKPEIELLETVPKARANEREAFWIKRLNRNIKRTHNQQYNLKFK